MSNEKGRKPRHKSSGGEISAPRSIMYGLIWTAGLSAVLLALFSAIVYATPDPGSLVLPAALAAAYIASFFGGLASSWINHGESIPCGLITGGGFFVILILLSLIIPGGAGSKIGFWASAGLHALIIIFSLLGAFAGTSLRESGKRKRPKRR